MVSFYTRDLTCKRNSARVVYVMNVGGGGDIANMLEKGSKTGWINYQAFASLGGQSLSFKLTSYTSHETVNIAYNVAPSNWRAGMTNGSKLKIVAS